MASAVLAGLLLSAAAARAQAAGDPFAACEQAFADDPQGWKTCGCFYQVAIESGSQEEAIERLERHRGNDPDNPCLAFSLGRLHQLVRGAAAAATLFRVAADGYADRGPADGEIYARMNLAEALAALGAAGDELSAELDRARQAAEASGDPVLLAEVAVKEAKLLVRRGGDVGWIEASLRAVQRDAFAEAHASLRRDILLTLGDVLYSRGRFAEAEEVFAEAVPVTVDAGDRFGEATARLNRAAAAGARSSAADQRASVSLLLEEAVVAAVAADNPFVEIEARKRVGRLLDGTAGQAQLQLAIARAEALGDRAPVQLASALAASAMAMLDDDPTEARRRVDEAAALLVTASDPWAQVYGWADRLRVLWATAPRNQALSAATSVLGLVESLERIQSTETARAEVSSVWTEVYQWLAGRLLADAEAGEATIGDAFAVSERMRARLLLESLVAGGVVPAAVVDAEDEAAWLDVERGIADLHRRLLDPRLAPDQRRRLLLELEELEAVEDRLAARRRQLHDASPSAVRELIELEALQATLTPEDAVLAFQVARWQALDGSFTGGSWLLVITAEDTHLRRLPDRDELAAAVEVFLHLFERRDGSEAIAAAGLYDQLLGDALRSLPARAQRLVVIPDGPLYRLPFAALRSEPDEPPLAATFDLSLVPSATVWRLLQRGAAAGDLTLALADPPVPAGERAPADSLSPRERSWTTGLVLPALPHARREARSALRHLGRPGRVLTGVAASEAALKAGAGAGLRVLHLGTHAVLDEVSPQRSAVILAPGGASEDGLLRPREAAALGLDGAVVVLASCQSAKGTLLQGEGALSLARAFLESGARAVVGSLWPLADKEAADVFDRFYRHLGRGEPVARALALAQRESLERGIPAAAWAGLIVLGDGGAAVAEPDGSRRPIPAAAWLAAAALLIAIAGLLLHRLRRAV